MPKRRSCDSDSMEVENRRPNSLLVSFTKRRQGLFRKASDLCTKSGAQIAVLVLSPSENPFAFGHSSVDDVLRRYDSLRGQTAAMIGEEESAMSERQKWQARELEALRVRVREKERFGRESPNTSLISDNVEDCESVEELEGFKAKYLDLLHKIREKLGDDTSFISPGSGSSCNVGNDDDLFRCQQDDMSFSSVKSACVNCGASSSSGGDRGVRFDPVVVGSSLVDRQENKNDMSFCLAKYENYGRNSSDSDHGFFTVDDGLHMRQKFHVASFSRREINKGIGVDNMHYLNDGLWKMKRLD